MTASNPTAARRAASIGTAIVIVASVAVAVAVAGVARGEPDERDLRDNVEASLRLNHSLADETIDVRVSDGRVALAGRVRTLLRKWEALETAASVRGVVAIEDGIEVVGQPRRDAALEDDVRRRFEDIPRLASSGLRVTARDGVVSLTGTVRDARMRFAARDAVAAITGVFGVVDAIESPPAADAAIQDAVQELLGPRSLRRVPGAIEASVEDGIVTIDGWVRRLIDRIEAEKTVLGINGVKDVVNRLEIRPKPSAEDSLR